MTKILLDTNFLLVPILQRVDVFSQVQRLLKGDAEFQVLTPVLEELSSLAQGKGASARAAKSMLQYAKKHFPVVNVEGSADSALLQHAKKTGAVVATGDAVLRARLKSAGVKVLVLKNNNALVWG